jgi:hypothetical protein
MVHSRRAYQLISIFWAVLQLALPGTLATLDGLVALRGDDDVRAHVEGSSSKSCQPPHSADCGICRYLSLQGADDSHAPQAAVLPQRSEHVRSDCIRGHAGRAIARPLSRAPPLL